MGGEQRPLVTDEPVEFEKINYCRFKDSGKNYLSIQRNLWNLPQVSNRPIRQLVTTEPVEVQDCRKITDHFRGIL
jgi:hypothetical protein